MLAVHDLEIAVGARRLMADVEFRVGDGDKVGLVGRNGAGKTTLTKVLAGESQPSAGRVERSGEIGYLPQDPRAGDPEQLARTRILDARGLGSVDAAARRGDRADGLERPGGRREGDQPVRAARGGVPRPRRLRGGGRGRCDRLEPRAARPDPRPAAEDALRRPAAPHRAGPHPVLRRRHPHPRRADEPPRRGLDHLAARVPEAVQGRCDRHQPRRRPRRRRREPRVLPRREPAGARRLQHGLAPVPEAARDRRAAAQARAAERREEGLRPAAAGREDGREGHEGRRRAEHGAPRRAPALRARGGPPGGAGREAALPGSRALRQDAARWRPTCRSRTAPSRSSPPSTSRSTAARRSSCSG